METLDIPEGKEIDKAAIQREKEIQKIEKLSFLIRESYGKGIYDSIGAFYRNQVIGKNVTIDEYAKLINEDEQLKLLFTCLNQRKLKKIHFWILFWSIITFVSAGIILIYFLIKEFSYY